MKGLQHVFFIVNANPIIGFGHLSRCILLAEEFKKKGVKATFLSYEIAGNKNVVTKLFPHQKYENLDALFTYLSTTLHKHHLIIIDTDNKELYELSYQNKILKTGAKLMHITMKNNMQFKSHIVLNQNIIGLDFVYHTEPYTQKMIGPKYFILGDAFQQIEKNQPKEATKNILITCGNTDPNDVTIKILDFLEQEALGDLTFTIVVGGGNASIDNIRNHKFCIQNKEYVTIHHNIDNMYAVMKNSDIAISTIGLTYWELILHNIPCMLVSGSKREKEQINYFITHGYAHYLGDYDDEKWVDKWSENFRRFNKKDLKIEELNTMVNVNGKRLIVENILKMFM